MDTALKRLPFLSINNAIKLASNGTSVAENSGISICLVELQWLGGIDSTWS